MSRWERTVTQRLGGMVIPTGMIDLVFEARIARRRAVQITQVSPEFLEDQPDLAWSIGRADAIRGFKRLARSVSRFRPHHPRRMGGK